MPISVRLDKETEEILEKTSRILGTSKTDVIKKSLKEYCSGIMSGKGQTPYELTKDLLGKEGSGKGDLSIRGEEILRALFRRKRIDRN
jgi:hypothetical protein